MLLFLNINWLDTFRTDYVKYRRRGITQQKEYNI